VKQTYSEIRTKKFTRDDAKSVAADLAKNHRQFMADEIDYGEWSRRQYQAWDRVPARREYSVMVLEELEALGVDVAFS